MNDRAALLAAQLDAKAPVIDLHQTDSVAGALELLERELFSLYKEGESYCRVVHGLGDGVLSKAVQETLQENPLVAQWEVELHGGSCVVVLVQKG